MTEEVETITIEDTNTVPKNAGTLLKEARESKKLSVSEVASELRLTKSAVESIEKQQWEELHGRAYARGYFLNYVRFLALDESVMLAAFENEYSAEEKELNLAQQEQSAKRFPWMGFIFSVLAIVITWFAYQHWQTTQVTSTEQEQEQQPEWSDDVQSSIEPLQETDPFNQSVIEPIPAVPETEQPISEEVNEVVEEVDAADVTEQALAFTQENLQQDILNEHVEVQPVTETVTEIAEQNELVEVSMSDDEATAEQPLSAKTELVLAAKSDCWVEVTDAKQQILYYDLIKADDTVTIIGEAPVKVLLGSASGIQVTVNGNQFDTSSFVHGDVARFTVGVES